MNLTNENQTVVYLKRIAEALERIAAATEREN
jgi:hypothetical protein